MDHRGHEMTNGSEIRDQSGAAPKQTVKPRLAVPKVQLSGLGSLPCPLPAQPVLPPGAASAAAGQELHKNSQSCLGGGAEQVWGHWSDTFAPLSSSELL